MKKRTAFVIFMIASSTVCFSGERLEKQSSVVLSFETKVNELLVSATNKNWWGYHDMPRLALTSITKTSPELGTYYSANPDGLLSLQLSALNTVYSMMDKNYHTDNVPKEHNGLLFNGNRHMALLKKQRTAPESLTDTENNQLKFMRERELSNFCQMYLALCRQTIRASGTNSLLSSKVTAAVANSSLDSGMKDLLLNTNALQEIIKLR